jgi:hypothetical protein
VTELIDNWEPSVGFLVKGHAVTLPKRATTTDGVGVDFSILDGALNVSNFTRWKERYQPEAPWFSFTAVTHHFFRTMIGSRSAFEFTLTNHAIGHVEHVLGRDLENYVGQGTTSQMIVSLHAEGQFTPYGLSLRLRGDLAVQEGQFEQAVVPSLAKDSYDISVESSWNAVRFLLRNHLLANVMHYVATKAK